MLLSLLHKPLALHVKDSNHPSLFEAAYKSSPHQQDQPSPFLPLWPLPLPLPQPLPTRFLLLLLLPLPMCFLHLFACSHLSRNACGQRAGGDSTCKSPIQYRRRAYRKCRCAKTATAVVWIYDNRNCGCVM